MLYKNKSTIAKTFYGICFKPGTVHDVPGYINDKQFEAVLEAPEKPSKVAETRATTKKDKEETNG